jgi:hypothetical protein
MHASPGMGRGCGVDGRLQERVGEPDPAAGALRDARRFGPLQAGRCPIPSCRRNHQILCRAGRSGDDEEHIGGTRR